MPQINTQLSLHQRDITLFRFPKRNNETFQAWDAGDEYLINYVEELSLDNKQNILILNDSFGALSCWFSKNHSVTMMSDSFISHSGCQENLKINGGHPVNLLNALDKIPGNIDLVLFQIPKSNRLLRWQLFQLRTQLPNKCQVIAVNKAKDIHTSTLNLFRQYLGEPTTSLAWKKHRLIFCQPDSAHVKNVDPVTRWPVDEHNFSLKNYPNTYSGESLDLGARFMMKHLPCDPTLNHVIDLGCGNGVLSIKMGQLNPQIKITCIDESFMAIDSARLNLQETLGNKRSFDFVSNNCLDGFPPEHADFVICNPPFHQNNAITDHIAWQMFCDTKQVLCSGGKLMVIGNRHLGYDIKLSRLFGKQNVKQIACNNKFVILQATK